MLEWEDYTEIFYVDKYGHEKRIHGTRQVMICERCGLKTENWVPRHTKYCPACEPIVRAEKNRERVRKFREKQQNK